MCGIAGFLTGGCDSPDALAATAAQMARTLVHRGPDDQGVWTDPSVGLAFGFQRLAIQDVSPTGHQPMQSATGRYTIVFNGEIYNFRELRQEMEPLEMRGKSDTECLLAAMERWGVTNAVKRSVGMFAFAVWDARERRLHLVRDRMGEKPLYYGAIGGAFLFASELKALKTHPAFEDEIDRDALTAYLRHGYVPSPHSVYRNVRKLMPGVMLTVRIRADRSFELATPQSYWSVGEGVQRGVEQPFEGTDEEAIGEFDRLLSTSIRQQMIADVPLGAFLSGGVDSSLVVAEMQRQSNRPIKSFTIGFRDQGFDEAPQARRVASHLGTDHTELYVSPEDAAQLIPSLARVYDEPFSDSSQLPTLIVSQLARSEVTVSLSGDGGDELFGGYSRYQRAGRLWRNVSSLPRSLRLPAGQAGQAMLNWAAVADRGQFGRLYAAAQLLAADQPLSCYRTMVSRWKAPSRVVIGGNDPLDAFTNPARAVPCKDFLRSAMTADAVSYLPDDILVKVDRASMAVSLESRAPMLDHRIVEFSQRLPSRLLARDGRTKWLLRQALRRRLPDSLIENGKRGFAAPLGDWLRGSLRDWAEDLLSESRLRRDGFFEPRLVSKKWREHCRGRRDRMPHVWSILMFNSWLDANAASKESLNVQRPAA